MTSFLEVRIRLVELVHHCHFPGGETEAWTGVRGVCEPSPGLPEAGMPGSGSQGPSNGGHSWLATFSSRLRDLSSEPLTRVRTCSCEHTARMHTRVNMPGCPTFECPPGPCCCPPGGPQASARSLVTSWRKIAAGAWWPGLGGGPGRPPRAPPDGGGSAKLLPHQKRARPTGAEPGLSAEGRAPAAVFHTPTDATRSWPTAKLMGPRWEPGRPRRAVWTVVSPRGPTSWLGGPALPQGG